tara:strand:- start:53 stop:238 length:186 start_codon:yes stop_codon:yes gene_type:complete
MSRPTTQELKETLTELVQIYNKAIETQTQTKEKIIAVQAVIQDRESENGNTNTVASEITED